MQEKETGVIESGDALNHGTINAIIDGTAEAVSGGFFALQFVLRFTVLADVVFDRGIRLCSAHSVFSANGAVHISGEPVLTQNSGYLCSTLVARN